jgi:hypothetical protein
MNINSKFINIREALQRMRAKNGEINEKESINYEKFIMFLNMGSRNCFIVRFFARKKKMKIKIKRVM